MPTVSSAGSKNWIISPDDTRLTFPCWPRPTSGQLKSSGWRTVCHRNDRLTEGSGTAKLARRSIGHHAVTVQSLEHLEATAIQVMMANKPVKILAPYPSRARPLIASDLPACLGDGLPVLIAGDLNAKHVDWNSRLITKRQTLSWLCE